MGHDGRIPFLNLQLQSLPKLMNRWRVESVSPVAAASADEVKCVFAEVGSVSTPDVVALDGTLGGMAQMDNEF
jgi:hypothetical protein